MILKNKNLNKIFSISAIVLLLAVVFVGFNWYQASAQTYTTIGRQLEVGSRGSDVSELQRFLASNSLVYPEKLVTGYYGPLTEKAVRNFQVGYNISPVGRVGPITTGEINRLILSGKTPDVASALIGAVDIDVSSNSAEISWSTSEPTQAKVYYSANPLIFTGVTTAKTVPTVIASVVMDNTFGISKKVEITGLSGDTTYHYTIVTVDDQGNVSMTWPSMFTTN